MPSLSHSVTLEFTNSTRKSLDTTSRLLRSGDWHVVPVAMPPQATAPDAKIVAGVDTAIEGIVAYNSPDPTYTIVFYFSSLEPNAAAFGNLGVYPTASTVIGGKLMAELRKGAKQKSGTMTQPNVTAFGQKYDLVVDWNGPANSSYDWRYEARVVLRDLFPPDFLRELEEAEAAAGPDGTA